MIALTLDAVSVSKEKRGSHYKVDVKMFLGVKGHDLGAPLGSRPEWLSGSGNLTPHDSHMIIT